MIRRVLIVQPYGIGDLLFLTPVFRALKKMPGIERVDLLLGSRTEAVVTGNPNIDRIDSIDKDVWHREGNLRALRDLWNLTRKYRKEKYDLMLDYSLRGEYGFMAAFLWGIPVRAGFDYKRRGFFHNVKTAIPSGFEKKHVTDYFCGLAEKCGIPVADKAMEYFVSPREDAAAGEILKKENAQRFLAVTVGGGESWGKDAHFKRWPARYFARLSEKLMNRYGLSHVILLGSPGERELAGDFLKNFSGPALNLCGKTNLGISTALIQKAALFLGNDGGLMHLAHALKTPVAALFGPVDPAVYGPYPSSPQAVVSVKKDLACRPCYQKFRYNSACEHRDCLQKLTPEEVLAAIEEKNIRI